MFSEKYDTYLLCYSNDRVILRRKDLIVNQYPIKLNRKATLFSVAQTLIKEYRMDYYYIRYPKTDCFYLRLLRKISKVGGKVVVEIPTYPYDKEIPYGENIVQKSLRQLDRCLRNKQRKLLLIIKYIHLN